MRSTIEEIHPCRSDLPFNRIEGNGDIRDRMKQNRLARRAVRTDANNHSQPKIEVRFHYALALSRIQIWGSAESSQCNTKYQRKRNHAILHPGEAHIQEIYERGCAQAILRKNRTVFRDRRAIFMTLCPLFISQNRRIKFVRHLPCATPFSRFSTQSHEK